MKSSLARVQVLRYQADDPAIPVAQLTSKMQYRLHTFDFSKMFQPYFKQQEIILCGQGKSVGHILYPIATVRNQVYFLRTFIIPSNVLKKYVKCHRWDLRKVLALAFSLWQVYLNTACLNLYLV